MGSADGILVNSSASEFVIINSISQLCFLDILQDEFVKQIFSKVWLAF